MKDVKTKFKGVYNGHNVKGNGDVDLNIKCSNEEMVGVLGLVSMLGRNISVKSKCRNANGGKPFDLGTFYLKNINIDRNGEAKVKLNTEVECSEINSFVELVDKEILIDFLCVAKIEEADAEEENDDEEDEDGNDDED